MLPLDNPIERVSVEQFVVAVTSYPIIQTIICSYMGFSRIPQEKLIFNWFYQGYLMIIVWNDMDFKLH